MSQDCSDWVCPECNEELGELNGYCEYCYVNSNIKIYNPNKYYVREIRLYHLSNRDNPMTPQEQLFADFFSKHAMLVRDMSILELRAYREEMSKIASEAKAGVYAADAAERELKKKASDGKPKGFERTFQSDGVTSEAINTIKERQKKLTKMERIREGLLKIPGMDKSFADKVVQNRNILDQTKKRAQNTAAPEVKEPGEPVFNPFEKKS